MEIISSLNSCLLVVGVAAALIKWRLFTKSYVSIVPYLLVGLVLLMVVAA